jgi:hypothetical protein
MYLKSSVLVFLLLSFFHIAYSQDYVVKKKGDTIYGEILHWNINFISLSTTGGKYTSFKPSNIRSYYFGEKKLKFTSTDVLNKPGKIFLPDVNPSVNSFFFCSGDDSLKMLKIDTFTVYVLQDKNLYSRYRTDLNWTRKANPNRLFLNIDDFAADNIYLETPSLGLNCVYSNDMSQSGYENSFNLLRKYFQTNNQVIYQMIHQRNTNLKESQKPEFIYNAFYAFFTEEKFPELTKENVDIIRFPF